MRVLLRRLLRPADLRASSPLDAADPPGCFLGALDLEAETEPAGEMAAAEAEAATAAPLASMLGKEVAPGLLVSDLVILPSGGAAASGGPSEGRAERVPKEAPPRVVFLWRAGWRGTPLEDLDLLDAPLPELPARLGFDPGDIYALLADRVRFDRDVRRTRALAPRGAPLLARVAEAATAIPRPTLAILAALALAAAVAALAGTRLRLRPWTRALLAVFALAALAAAALLAVPSFRGLGDRSDPEAFFALDPDSTPPLADLRVDLDALRAAGIAVSLEGKETALFAPDGPPRFASPTLRRLALLGILPALGNASSVVAASPRQLLLARALGPGPRPASVALVLVPIADPAPGSRCVGSPASRLLFAAVSFPSLEQTDALLLRGTFPSALSPLPCVPELDPDLPPRLITFAAASGSGQSSRAAWDQTLAAGLATARAAAANETFRSRPPICDPARQLESWFGAPEDFGLPAYFCGPPLVRPPSSGDPAAPLVSTSIVDLRLAAAACPPGSGRHLSARATLEADPPAAPLRLFRSFAAPDSFFIEGQIPQAAYVVERTAPGAETLLLRSGNRYLAPPLSCARGEPPELSTSPLRAGWRVSS